MKIMKNAAKILFLIIFTLVISCEKKQASPDLQDQQNNEIQKIKITEREVQRFDNDNFIYIIKFSNLIYVEKGKLIKIPIFQGEYGDTFYTDFKKYCREQKILDSDAVETGFIIKAKNGELKKIFQEFIKFYKSNILANIDINKPTKLDLFGDEEKYCDWEIYYDFEAEGVPFVLKITVKASGEDFANRNDLSLYKSIFQLNPDESMDNPHFMFSIYSNYRTRDLFYK